MVLELILLFLLGLGKKEARGGGGEWERMTERVAGGCSSCPSKGEGDKENGGGQLRLLCPGQLVSI